MKAEMKLVKCPLTLLLFLMSMLATSLPVNGYGQSMEDCLGVAKMFRNTCDILQGASKTVKLIPGEIVSCNDVGQCGGTAAGFQCTWVRRLCVTCFSDTATGGVVKMRVQSNGRPDHCYFSPVVAPRDLDLDYEVDFNTFVSPSHQVHSPLTQAGVDDLVCNASSISDSAIPTNVHYKRHVYHEYMSWPPAADESLDRVVGLALNGVPFITSLDTSNTDLWGSTVHERVEEAIDSCLGYVTPSGMYSYPMIPVCIHDRRDAQTLGDVMHPGNSQYLCSFSDDGHHGCKNRTSHAIQEYLTSVYISKEKTTTYEDYYTDRTRLGKNHLVHHYRRLNAHMRGRKLSLEESPYIGMPKFFVSINTRELSPTYTISGAAGNPTLTLERGKTYVFEVLTHGHPFMIQYTNELFHIGAKKTGEVVGSAGIAYTDGVVITRRSDGDSGLAGVDSGTIVFTVPANAPPTLHYRCTKHGVNIQGEIRIHHAGTTALGTIGCDGIAGSGKTFDDCGVCGGTNTHKDACGLCFGDNATCTGCDGVPLSGKVLDVCGVCGGNDACENEDRAASEIAHRVSPRDAHTKNQKMSSPHPVVKNQTVQNVTNARNTEVILGLAKDGHFIFGPYYKDGSEATAGFDVCNGVHFDRDGDKSEDVYGYFSRKTFPYVVGCFGPGNYPQVLPSCTSSPPTAYLPWLNFTYPGVAPLPFDNGEFQLLPTPKTVDIPIRSGWDLRQTRLYSCDQLEKFIRSQSKTVIVGSSLQSGGKHTTVVFDTPFLAMPSIDVIQVDSSQTELAGLFTFVATSVSTTQFTFLTTKKSIAPWNDILRIKFTARAHEKHENTLRCAVVEMSLIASSQSVFAHFVNVSNVVLTEPLLFHEDRSIVVSGTPEKTTVSPASTFGMEYLEHMIHVGVGGGHSVSLRRLILTGCVAGCIKVVHGGIVTLSDVVLEKSTGSIHGGGGMLVEDQGKAILFNTKFLENLVHTDTYESIASGGGLFIATGGTVDMTGGGFERNVVSNSKGDAYGGAVVNWGSLTVSDALIQHNVATGGLMDRHGESGAVGHGHGGAISHHGTYIMVKDSTIYNNSASRSGGAIYTTKPVSMRRCLIRNNSAYMGSAYRSPSYVEPPNLEECDVFWNSCRIERSSGQAETESYFPGQTSVPLQLAYGSLVEKGIPPQQISYYDNQ